jgi:hypothetical protein
MLEDAPPDSRRPAPDDRRAATGPRRAATGPRRVPEVISAGGTAPGPSGSRSARKKRGVLRRTGVILPASGIAVLLVVVVTVASYVTDSRGSGAASLFQSINSLGNSSQVAALEQERQNIIAMDAATQTLTTAAKPAAADMAAILAARTAAASPPAAGGGTGVTTIAPPANPTSAEALGKELLVSYGGFSSGQWSCLYSLWERESGWNVYAENGASGAYGIPQSLPGDKMATIAADWQTNPATQIKWGLSYIKATYGTPCAAWNNEVNYGYY